MSKLENKLWYLLVAVVLLSGVMKCSYDAKAINARNGLMLAGDTVRAKVDLRIDKATWVDFDKNGNPRFVTEQVQCRIPQATLMKIHVWLEGDIAVVIVESSYKPVDCCCKSGLIFKAPRDLLIPASKYTASL